MTSSKTILITGATDGLGLGTARELAAAGHRVVIHGRSEAKLERAASELADAASGSGVETRRADLSDLAQVAALADAIALDHDAIDVLINNAGVFTTPAPRTPDGLDVRFAVNTIAPYLLTTRLLPRLGPEARVVNLSSAAQAPVDLDALAGEVALSDGEAYAQSKLALTMWTRELATHRDGRGPSVVAVNPGSFLGTKMVREAYGRQGVDVGVGIDILRRAALSDEFTDASGLYFDNDSGRFTGPHPAALVPGACEAVTRRIDDLLSSRDLD